MVTWISPSVRPSLQLVKVTRLAYWLAVMVTWVPASYMFLPSTTVGSGLTVTM